MTMNSLTSYSCDRCGGDCGNGSVVDCLVIMDVNNDTGMPVQYHFCRDTVDEDGKVAKKGCARKLLSVTNLAHFHEGNADGAE